MSVDDIFRGLSPDQIVFRDEAIIAVDKPAGLSTASSDGADDLVARVRLYVAQERGVDPSAVYVGVHEHLERDSSGIVVLTLDKRANRGLAEQLEASSPLRTFRAVYGTRPQARTIDATHQRAGAVRAQLARKGTPVIGDVQQGGAPAHRAMCHTQSISLRHPITQAAITIERDAPASLRKPHDCVRDLTNDPTYRDALLSEAFSKRRSIRQHGTDHPTNAMRLINGAADGFDGIAVDLYDEWLIFHVFDERWHEHADVFARSLRAATQAAGVYIKQHPRQKNDLAADAIAMLAGDRPAVGNAATDPLRVVENGVPLFVRLGDGLRTGLFLDQRLNRDLVRREASGKRVLNLFAYTCGFSVAAIAGGARDVTSVDASALVMSRADAAMAEIGAGDRHHAIVGDCFDVLENLVVAGRRFDLLVIDPPSYASTSAGRFRLRRDYAKLVAAASTIAAPSASVLCCTNHHGTTERDLRQFALQGVRDARRSVRRSRLISPPVDFAPAPGQVAELKSLWIELE